VKTAGEHSIYKKAGSYSIQFNANFTPINLENSQYLKIRGGWRVAQTMYTHVSECKNDKIKRNKNKRKENVPVFTLHE
jgi:hypothetical protein